MTDAPAPTPTEPEAVASELVDPSADGESESRNSVDEPAKVMRVGTMIRQLLDEVRQTSLDEPSRDRLREIYETSIKEIADSVSPDLRDELDRLALPFGEGTPTDAELRVAQAQLVGWLEGLFHGIQATLFAQQMAARNQLEDMRKRLPPGVDPSGVQGPAEGGGTYL
ncbi:MAG TPA: bacterial proteasome activator family protein [Acidimicrobiales bacterium]|nr:bacterial proteasome activator family protein [Acidimicrobiales bacterium]